MHDETGEELRKTGNEFGATTGRPRRCGWIDLVALRYACMINGVTSLVMTKADVLDNFTGLKLCVAYRINGNETTEIPFRMEKFNIEPVYKDFSGWNTNISAAKGYKELPVQMKSYIEFINQYTGVEIDFISNGPEREQIVKVD